MAPRIGPSFAKTLFQPSHENGVVIMVTRLEPSRSHVYSCKSCIHLRRLTVRRFGIVGATGLKKLWRWGHLQWHDLPTEFLENLPSEVIGGDKQMDNMVTA
jgi:hypothetical protein